MRNALAAAGLLVVMLIVGCQSAEEPTAVAEDEPPPVEAPAEEPSAEEPSPPAESPEETPTEVSDEQAYTVDETPLQAAAPLEWPAFPWPPPMASTIMNIDDAALRIAGDGTTLGHVDERLVQALNAAGYVEKSYFAVPDGFALVTRLEQIDSNGTPLDPPDRWSAEAGPLREFNLRSFFRALFTANPGHFRILVFVATPHPFYQSDQEVYREAAMGWLSDGVNRLPDPVARRPYTEAFRMTVLVYEFEQLESDDAQLVVPSRLTARTHLARSGVLTAIEQDREDRP